LIELSLAVRDGRTDKLVTTARFYQPSIRTKSPAGMIREILIPWFGPAATADKK
jgi:hypothetical protein